MVVTEGGHHSASSINAAERHCGAILIVVANSETCFCRGKGAKRVVGRVWYGTIIARQIFSSRSDHAHDSSRYFQPKLLRSTTGVRSRTGVSRRYSGGYYRRFGSGVKQRLGLCIPTAKCSLPLFGVVFLVD